MSRERDRLSTRSDEVFQGVLVVELFNDWGGRGYNDSVSVEVAKTVPSGDRTT